MCRRRAEIKRVEHVQFLGFQPCGTPTLLVATAVSPFLKFGVVSLISNKRDLQVHCFIPPQKKLELVKSWKSMFLSQTDDLLTVNGGVSVDELQMWILWGLCRLRASGAYRCLAPPTRKLRAMLRGLPVIWTSCNQDAFLLQTLLGGWCSMVYCYLYWCPKVSDFLHVCCIWHLNAYIIAIGLQVMVMGASARGMKIPTFTHRWNKDGLLKKGLRAIHSKGMSLFPKSLEWWCFQLLIVWSLEVTRRLNPSICALICIVQAVSELQSSSLPRA